MRPVPPVAALLMFVCCGVSGVAYAQFESRTPPVEFYSPHESFKHDAHGRIATSGAGVWIATWSGFFPQVNGSEQTMSELFYSRSLDNGLTWSTPALIDPLRPAELGDIGWGDLEYGAGVWILTWTRGTIGTANFLYSRSTDNGATWSSPDTLQDDEHPHVSSDNDTLATDGAGNWVFLWSETQNVSDDYIFGRRSSDHGATWTPASVVLGPLPDGGLAVTDLESDRTGVWIAAISQARSDTSLTHDAWALRSTDDGASWAAPIEVGVHPITSPISDSIGSLDTDRNGNWVAVLNRRDSSGQVDVDVYSSRSTDNGLTWSTPISVNTYAAGDTALDKDEDPDITTDGAGNWIASWISWSSFFNLRRYVARSTDNGATWGPQTPIHPENSPMEKAFNTPMKLATDRAGTWIGVWETSPLFELEYRVVYTRWTGILEPDRDGDNLSDADELVAGTNIDTWDTDGDALSDTDEIDNNTNPLTADTDGDGVWDSIEISLGTDPNDPFDFPNLPLTALTIALATAAIALGAFVVFRHARKGAAWMSRVRHILFAAALCTAPGLASAQYHLHTAPATLNTDAAADTKWDVAPRIKADGAGNWIALWSATEPPFSSFTDAELTIARSIDNGVSWSDPTLVNPSGIGDGFGEFSARLETDGAGLWIAVWTRYSIPALSQATSDVYIARSTDNGASWTTPVPLEASPDSLASAPDLATDGADNWIAVWSMDVDQGPDMEIRISRSTDNGMSWSDPGDLNLNADDDFDDGLPDSRPRIATDSAGHWVVIWTGYFGDVLDRDILGARSNDNGITWTYPESITPNANADTINEVEPNITTDNAGHWIVVWSAAGGPFSSDNDVFSATSTDNGASWTAAVPINSSATTDSEPDVTAGLTTDGAGNWIASWFSWEGTLVEPRRHIARSTDNGASWGPESIIDSNGGGVSDSSAASAYIMTDRLGTWIAAWDLAMDREAVENDDLEIYFTRWTGILEPDRDGDNLSDADEFANGTNRDAWDTDGDNLSDDDELNTYPTNPFLADTDGDGVWDNIEIALGTDPNDPMDFPLLPLSWMALATIVAGIGLGAFFTVHRSSRR